MSKPRRFLVRGFHKRDAHYRANGNPQYADQIVTEDLNAGGAIKDEAVKGYWAGSFLGGACFMAADLVEVVDLS